MTAAWFDRAGELVSSVEAADAADIAEQLLFRLALFDAPDAIEVGFASRERQGSPPLGLVWIDEPADGPVMVLMCTTTARHVAERIREDQRFAHILKAPDVLAARLVMTADHGDQLARRPSLSDRKVLHS